MPENNKNMALPRISSPAWSGLYKVAIVGASTLKGKELKDILDEHNFPASDIRLLDDEEGQGQLDAIGDEATVVLAVEPAQFEGVDLAFFASDEAFTRKTWQWARNAGCFIVDLSCALETGGHDAMVPVRAPWLDKELEPQTDMTTKVDLKTTTIMTADPAAIVLGLLLLRAAGAGTVLRSMATVFEPVSEHGKRGMDELHQQTLNLLSFQPMPRQIFDAQLAFNLLSRYGAESVVTLESVEQRITRHFERITRSRIPMPALQVVQAPTFHTHIFSIYLELEGEVSAESLAHALRGEHVSVVESPEEAPNNVNAAGQDEILVSVRADASRRNGFWLWVAADNLKIAALTAAESALFLVAGRPSGKIQ